MKPVIYKDFYKTEYRLNDLLHREDGPAIEWHDGTKHWFRHGLLHRENGPAVEWTKGGNEYYCNGILHREDGPAVETPEGSKFWYKDGQRHRTTGPAIEYFNGFKSWYVNGVDISNSVRKWISDNGINTDYNVWTNKEKLNFKLSFT